RPPARTRTSPLRPGGPRDPRRSGRRRSRTARRPRSLLLQLLLAVSLVLAVALALGVQQLLVEVEALVVEDVAHPLRLRAQVGGVVFVRGVLDRDLGADREAVALEAADLLRVV